jgi:ankyrin repeat protein
VSSVDNLKKEAKRWLKALRSNAADARARLTRAYPAAPDDPGLRHIQHALAREHGRESWAALKAALAAGPPLAGSENPPADIVTRFLQFACWDHHTHGAADHRMYDRAAQRILAQHPGLAAHSLYAAVLCGNVEEVKRVIAGRAEAAREPGGPRNWTPILYLSYTRFTHPATVENAIEIARLLLDHGANPNDFYMAGDSEYSCLVGAAGEGEQDSPRQPYAEQLYELLLAHGAGPYDIQVLYDTHFSGDMLWWLELTYQRSLALGRKSDWDDPDWSMLDMGGYGSGAFFVLGVAIKKNDLALADWALKHGADPNSDTSANPKFRPTRTLYDMAVTFGQTEMARLLLKYGANAVAPDLTPDEAFIAACMRLDRAATAAMVQDHPEYLRSHRAMFEAARRDRPDVIALLLDLGVPLEIADESNARALHHAAGNNALRAARFLIERGAEVDPRETSYNARPIGWAAHGDHVEMLDFLSRHSRSIWTLTFRGYVDRVRQILRDNPDLVKETDEEGNTPLWWLPDDEAKAMELVELMLAAGADPAWKNQAGRKAADWARTRGMMDIARRLTVDGAEPALPEPAPAEPVPAATPRDLTTYEALAQDLVSAYDAGDAGSMRRLRDHFGVDITWARVRAIVPQQLERFGHPEKAGERLSASQARLLVARGSGFDSWTELEAAISGDGMTPITRAIVVPPPDPSGAPVEMRAGFTMRLQDNSTVATADVWSMLIAARDGDLERVTTLAAAAPALVRCEYNYMPPVHLAAREGHLEIVRFLADRGGVNPKYKTYPYNEPLVTVAADRGYGEIAEILRAKALEVDPDRPEEEVKHIEYETDFERRRFQRLVGANALSAVEAMLEKRPELATDPFTFWSEGVLSMPANPGDRAMLELLLRYGARVPDMTKWGREYYFKRHNIAAFLMDAGMNPNHMNCHRTTLLHGMAQLGEVRKATLLLDHGADINALDDEFRSTPLGLAARWGQRKMVTLLLDRGADPTLAGADWATPREWARKKGHTKIAAALL